MDSIKLLLGIAIALCVFSITSAIAQETTVNTTTTTEEQEAEPETVATGQEAVPVITANGSNVAEVAPADAIQSLLTTIFTVAVPAIIGLITAIVAIVRTFSKDKKVNEALDTAVVAAKYIDTMAPKIQEQYVTSGAFKTAFQMLMNSLPEDQRKGIEQEIINKVPPVDARAKAAAAQIDQLRSQLPKAGIADNDKSLGDLERSSR